LRSGNKRERSERGQEGSHVVGCKQVARDKKRRTRREGRGKRFLWKSNKED
jgi:hypothetical protein